jgi:hypothetical protein
MPYFVRIGAIRSNQSGVGSRGYQLFRRGRNIVVRWGPVKVMPGRQFFWIYKQEKRHHLASETAARAEFHRLIEERARTYSQLPLGSRIR